ncbi:MAG: transporter substrate-binding domain-containing protein [Desulfobacterales bacterium]|nr:transporter substrate-binding domain-containing protein [Desulfobacterales bacterium]
MNFPSFSYQDEGDSEVRGYSVDVLNTICKKLEKTPHFLAGRSEDLLFALQNKDLDLVIGVMPDDNEIRSFNYLEISIFVKQYAFVYHPIKGNHFQDNPKRPSFVVAKGQPYLASNLVERGENIIQARTVVEALHLVNSGGANAYIDFSNQLITYLIGHHGLQNIRQAGVRMGRFPLTIITKKDNSILNPALSRALGEAIKSGELGKVREKWLGESYSSYLFGRFGVYIYGGAASVLTFLLAIFLWNSALKKQVRKITAKLLETEQRYEQLIESSPDMVFLINRKGAIRLANTSARYKLGLDDEKLAGLKVHDLLSDKDQGVFTSFLSTLFLEKIASTELQLKKGEETKFNVEIAAAILRRGSASERLACCFARDITKRKRMERELIHSERLATMGKMAAGVAHEVNNPIGIILSHTEDLLSGELNSAESQDSLSAIRRNAIRAGDITEALLNQASPAPAGREICDFRFIAAECINFLKPRLKNIRTKINLEQERYWIKCEESQIQQVLINILLNSVESIKGHGTIHLKLTEQNKEGKTWNRLRIEDSGKGIPEDDRAFVFDPFFTHGKKEGVGLGLFVAQRIITKHGGVIFVADSILGGAAMIVDLPQCRAE